MDGKVRRGLEMVSRALKFHEANPSDSQEYEVFLKGVGERLARAQGLIAQQRDGLIDVHAGSAHKQEVMRTIRAVHLPHLAEAGQAAAKDDHELAKLFIFKPGSDTLLGFRSATGAMLAAAQEHKEVLVKHGMSPQVLDSLVEALAEFDAAAELGSKGRAAHVGATAELTVLGKELVKSVRMMDAVNRLRFRDTPALLASWQNVSRVHATPRNGETEVASTADSTGAQPPAAAAPAEGAPVAPAPTGSGEARTAA
jgi:hypothetical protein